MTRDEVVALIVSKAHEYGIEPWELLGGAIAESGLNPTASRFGSRTAEALECITVLQEAGEWPEDASTSHR
jgi:hypothetical protein